MLIIGERINASREAICRAVEKRDTETIGQIASEQVAAGADYVDVNAGVFVGTEAAHLTWLVQTVQEAAKAPCCIDSPDPKAVEAALTVHQGTAMINSISLEAERFAAMLPLVSGTNAKVIALCMADEKMPETTDERLKIADRLVNALAQNNVAPDNIYVDPLVQPVSTNGTFGRAFLSAVERIMSAFPGIHTVCGLSNISFGLPARKLINRTFLAMAVDRGLDAAIIDPLDRQIMAAVRAAEAITGADDYCMRFIHGFRAGICNVS